jgi:hypothetical protein
VAGNYFIYFRVCHQLVYCISAFHKIYLSHPHKYLGIYTDYVYQLSHLFTYRKLAGNQGSMDKSGYELEIRIVISH